MQTRVTVNRKACTSSKLKNVPSGSFFRFNDDGPLLLRTTNAPRHPFSHYINIESGSTYTLALGIGTWDKEVTIVPAVSISY